MANGGPTSAQTSSDVDRLSVQQQVGSAFSGLGQFDDWQQQASDALAQLSPFLNIAKSIWGQQYTVDALGNKTKIGAGSNIPGQNWIDLQDRRFYAGLFEPLKQEREDQKHDLLVNWYINVRGFSPERAEQAASGWSIERGALTLAKMFQDWGLDKVVNGFLQREGINTASYSPGDDRRKTAVVNLVSRMYKAASGLSADSPFQGAISSKHMQTMLELYERGAFRNLMRMPGVFDMAGKLTEYGSMMVDQDIRSKASNVRILTQLTGQTDPVKAVGLMKTVFGDRFVAALGKPGIGKAMGTYYQAARLAGVTDPTQMVALLGNLSRITGRTDPSVLMAMASQKLSFDKLGMAGNPDQWNKWTMKLTADAVNSEAMKHAGAAAAALEHQYGRSAAWNIMQDVLRQGSRYRYGFLSEANKLLDPEYRLKPQDVEAMMSHPSAQAFVSSGLALPALTTIGAARMWNQLRSISPWIARHGNAILQRYGGFGREQVQAYANSLGARPQELAQILKHTDDVARQVNADPDALYGMISTSSNYSRRMNFLKEAERRGKDVYYSVGQAPDSGFRGAAKAIDEGSGVAGILQSILGGGEIDRSAIDTPPGKKVEVAPLRTEPAEPAPAPKLPQPGEPPKLEPTKQ